MDYVEGMRKLIGKAPLLVVAAGAIIHKDRKILLQKRVDNGAWAIHGGRLELGESVEQTAAREVMEEIGVVPTKLRLYKVFSGEELHVFRSNGEAYGVNIVFFCDEYEGEPKPDNDEVIELRWFDVNDLPDNLNWFEKIALKDIDKVL